MNTTFSGLSEGLQGKVFENVFKNTLGLLKEVISEIMAEQKAVNDSLQKFKKQGGGAEDKELSDFDKMRIQLILDL